MAVKSTTSRDNRKRNELGQMLVKEEVKARIKLVADILLKDEEARTSEELSILLQSPDAVLEVEKRNDKKAAIKDRTKEFEDPPLALKEKCAHLVNLIKSSKNIVVYTGAGISTAASIPDYRGPNGVWTLLQQGKIVGSCNLSKAVPTFTHMALAHLLSKKIVSHIVSQNCDGLHLRSGLPRSSLSEVHGNMFIEVCKTCEPPREYIRLFDVTEKTSFRKHKTGRQCHKCGGELTDTIVHFGERGTLKSPLNWTAAIAVAETCDLILCLGSSLRVLRRYTCLWGLERNVQDRPKLCIVNLQWTPKDQNATLKIHGQCDTVMRYIVEQLDLEVPPYNRELDPLFQLATRLKTTETQTTTKAEIKMSNDMDDICDTIKQESGAAEAVRPPSYSASSLTTADPLDTKMFDVKLVFPPKEEVSDAVKANGVVGPIVEMPRRKPGRPKKKSRRVAKSVDCNVPNQNPGWFGKGCGKMAKYKKN